MSYQFRVCSNLDFTRSPLVYIVLGDPLPSHAYELECQSVKNYSRFMLGLGCASSPLPCNVLEIFVLRVSCILMKKKLTSLPARGCWWVAREPRVYIGVIDERARHYQGNK